MKNKKIEKSEEQKFRESVFKKTIQSFIVFIGLFALGYFLFSALINAPDNKGTPAPFRKIMDVNAGIFARGYNNPSLTKEFNKSIAARKVRVNGLIGMRDKLDTLNYKFKVVRYSEMSPMPSDTLEISIADLRTLPKTEVVFNFKCIEGWSQISWWGGVRFSDFAKKYHLATKNNEEPDVLHHPENLLDYTGLQTPDNKYFVGIDMPSMMHPQTILCYEFNGKPLSMENGSPLRLIIPVKYGIKHIKKIGLIYFSNTRPPDYWADRGYDYFAGL